MRKISDSLDLLVFVMMVLGVAVAIVLNELFIAVRRRWGKRVTTGKDWLGGQDDW